jgi:phage terminase small subunit
VPTHLTDAQKKIWRELVSQIPHGVLTKSDRLMVERTTVLVERSRHKHSTNCEIGCPGIFTASDEKSLNSYMSQVGMSPANRSKIQVVPEQKGKADDPWAEFENDASEEATQ